MRTCLFEDRSVEWLEPLALTRPAFDLLCGATSLAEKQTTFVRAAETGAVVRAGLAELARLTHPDFHINDEAWLHAGPVVMVNARYLAPCANNTDLHTPHVGMVGDQIAYAVLPAPLASRMAMDAIDDCMDDWKRALPERDAEGWLIDFPWQLVEHNAAMLQRDLTPSRDAERCYRPANLAVFGPSDRLRVDLSAQIEPHVVADTTRGPVVIDHHAVVQAFTRLEGPCYVGPHCWLMGAKVRGGTTIGPMCRVGGEIEASILQGYSNKYHEGFLGHSYVGEWVNLAAGVQVSDLRNDYCPVRMRMKGERMATGLSKVGAFFGDHTKVGIGALVNSGSLVGAFCNLLPTGKLLPREIPSFCSVWEGQLVEQQELGEIMATAGDVMRRRGRELTAAHHALFHHLHEETAAYRRRAVLEHEHRALRLGA
jgi:UDP-N-acetylglucosamine diphosphorylase/glucosamine-1-phosphate N-acetyltransferase